MPLVSALSQVAEHAVMEVRLFCFSTMYVFIIVVVACATLGVTQSA